MRGIRCARGKWLDSGKAGETACPTAFYKLLKNAALRGALVFLACFVANSAAQNTASQLNTINRLKPLFGSAFR